MMPMALAGAAVAQPPSVGIAPPVGRVAQAPSTPLGYYRQPAIRGSVLVFVAEGDVWKASTSGGVATRLTSHPGDEAEPAISPDGQWVAFTAAYEGPREVYVMPLSGGLPKRLTFDASRASVSGWTPDGQVIASTNRFSTLPDAQLTVINPATTARTKLELSQGADGCYDDTGKTLYFARMRQQGSWTKRYKGGSVQNLWKFSQGDAEATPLTADFTGTSKRPMWWSGRLYFISDRDGTMNIWSMTPDGGDLKQHTKHEGFDIMSASLGDGKIAYQLGADVWVFDIASGADAKVSLSLDSDLDQLREKWIEKPQEWITAANISPEGDRVAIVARGRVFVAPHRQGRLVEVCRDDTVRYREAKFLTGESGELSLVALSDQSGEIELWKLPVNGVGAPEQLTRDGTVLRWDAVPSPDGQLIAHHDKNNQLWVYDVKTKVSTKVDTGTVDGMDGLTWSGDSRWLAYTTSAENGFTTVRLYSADSGQVTTVTTDRYDSWSPAWSRDGQWLFFLSDRTLRTVVGSPWGPNQPDPFLDEKTKIYALGLKPGTRWPFLASDELQTKEEKEKKEKDKEKKAEPAKPGEPAPAEPAKDEAKDAKAHDDDNADSKKDDPKAKKSKKVEIVLEGLMQRVYEVPLSAGNYNRLTAGEKALFFTSTPSGFERKSALMGLEIKNEQIEAKTITGDVTNYQLSGDAKKLLIRKKDSMFIIDAAASPASDLDKKSVVLGGWTLSVIPRAQWRQMYIDSWRLLRDYFYDPKMHGVEWRAMLDKYMPLVDRVTTRAELSDVMAQLTGELSALHHFVYGGDQRKGPDDISIAAFGGVLERDEAAGGYRITRIYKAETDQPDEVSPLARVEVNAQVGDVIEMIDGVPTLSVQDYAVLLRAKTGRQVLLRIKPAKSPADGGGFGDARDAIIVPISGGAETELRYTDWTLGRREMVEQLGAGKIGYVHLPAMGNEEWENWVRSFYPIYNREGLIIDVRHNGGGNTDSWVLSKLMRKAWFYWSPRVGNPYWNMQYAFRGPMVVLCDERTGSDGEAFSEGFRRLGLGKVIGTRTWGGEIWLSSSNVLVDRGIATAAEIGVFGPEGTWLIEGHGVDPDIVVDNLPHATYRGSDAQLKAAIEHLQQRLKENPVPPVVTPVKPDKSFKK